MLAGEVDRRTPQGTKGSKKYERATNSFEVVAREWFEKHRHTWAASHSDKIIRRLEKDVFPWLGGKPLRKSLHAMLATNCSIVPVPPSKTNPLIQQRVFCFQPVDSCSVPQFSHPNEVRHDYQAPVPLALEPTRYFRFSCCRTAGLADCHENINRNGNPDVRLHRILGSTVEFFDPNTLFDLSFDLSKRTVREHPANRAAELLPWAVAKQINSPSGAST